MPPMNAEHAFWIRKVDRAVLREVRRRSERRRERAVDAAIGLATAASAAFLLYAAMLFACL